MLFLTPFISDSLNLIIRVITDLNVLLAWIWAIRGKLFLLFLLLWLIFFFFYLVINRWWMMVKKLTKWDKWSIIHRLSETSTWYVDEYPFKVFIIELRCFQYFILILNLFELIPLLLKRFQIEQGCTLYSLVDK